MNNINDFYLRDINLLTIFFGDEITLREVRLFFFIKENPYCTTKEIMQFLGAKNRSSIDRTLGRLHKGYKNKEDRERAFIFLWDNLKEMLSSNQSLKRHKENISG